MNILWDEWQESFQKIAVIGENKEGGMNRLAYSVVDESAYQCLAKMGREMGLKVHWDGAGNLW